MRRLFLPFVLLLFVSPFYGQSPEQLRATGDSLLQVKAYAEARKVYQEAIAEFRDRENFVEVAETAILVADAFYGERDYVSGVVFLSSILQEVQTPLNNTSALGRVYNYQGYFLKETNRIGDALKAYERALEQFLAVDPSSDSAIYTYKEVAQLCTRLLEYERALTYARAAEEHGSNGRYRFNIYNSFFVNYFYMEQFEEAATYYQLAKESVKRNKDLQQLNTIGFSLFLQLNDLTKAEEILEQLQKSNLDAATVFYYKGLLSEAQGDLQEADQFFRIAVDSLQPQLAQKHREHAKMLCPIGDYFLKRGELDYAIILFQQAIIQVYPNFNDTSLNKLPTQDQIHQESWAMTAPRRKGIAHSLRYQQSGDIADLEIAARCFALAQDAAEEVRRAYRSESAAIALGAYGYQEVEEAIQVEAELYRLTGNPQHLESIYDWMERSRATALSEAIERGRNAQLLAIPDSLVVAERDLRQLLVAERLAETENTARIDSLQTAYTLLNRNLQARFPDWERYLSSFHPADLQTVQQALGKRSAGSILYFFGQESCYALYIDKRNLQFQRLGSADSIQQAVANYLAFFSDRNQITNDPTGFGSASQFLFEQICLPLLSDRYPKNLWIIPDGPLSFLPYESLLTATPLNNSFGNWPWLLRQTTLHTAPSLSTAMISSYTPEKSGPILAFAPWFKEGDRDLAPLPESQREVEVWQLLPVRSRVGLGKLCTWEYFQDLSRNSRVIHLATHARINAETGDPEIEIADQTIGLPEIYQLEYPGSLVILSACESGLGAYRRGEGVMNFNRAFSYNGAAGLIASLWTVNDAATADLISSTARYLTEGKKAAAALQTSKLDWLEDPNLSNNKKSPYYWAALSYSGQTFLLTQPKGLPVWIYLAGGGAVVLLLIGFLWRRKVRAK